MIYAFMIADSDSIIYLNFDNCYFLMVSLRPLQTIKKTISTVEAYTVLMGQNSQYGQLS